MNVDVYDTHAHTTDGQVLHFDVLLPSGSGAKALEYAREWLQSIGIGIDRITLDQCRFCHSEAATPEVQRTAGKQRVFHPANGRLLCPIFKLEKPGGHEKALVTHYVRGSTHRRRRDHSRRRSAGLPRGLSNLDTSSP